LLKILSYYSANSYDLHQNIVTFLGDGGPHHFTVIVNIADFRHSRTLKTALNCDSQEILIVFSIQLFIFFIYILFFSLTYPLSSLCYPWCAQIVNGGIIDSQTSYKSVASSTLTIEHN